MRTHFGQHGPGCFGCKIQTTQFGNVEAPPQRATERHLFGADRDAYYRLRQDGAQPKSIRGSAQLEALANSEREIREGRIISRQAWREAGGMVEDAEAVVRECTLQPNSEQAKELGEKVRAMAKADA